MCLCCQAGLEKTYKKFNTEELDVHHIIPIEEDFNLRLSDDNLITICKVHHEMCEAGIISREQQMSLLSKTSEDVGFWYSREYPRGCFSFLRRLFIDRRPSFL